jgi:[acyl-carrier-protein] S-malonyltransferase
MAEKKYIFLFPGQGAQYPGMGLDLFDASSEVRSLFEAASEIMGRDMRQLLAEADAETLKRGDVAQPAVTLVNLAAASVLKAGGVLPAVCAGHSLGEYAALAVSGVITAEESLLLTARRGELMREASENVEGGMAAVIGLPSVEVEKAVGEWTDEGLHDLYVANLNSPLQTVVSGTKAALAEAEERFRQAGARRFIRLAVSGPFHSPLMTGVVEKFAIVASDVEFRDPVVPLFSNVTGKQVLSGDEAKALALYQICGTVRWLDEERAIASAYPIAALEAGPGRALAGLWKDSGASTPCLPAGTAAAIADITKF